MRVSLVIMAAGLGSRYGGSKQVDGIGPHNEILMEYSIYDAIRAGFSKVVFIIKPEMEALMHRLCGDYLAKRTAADGSPVEVAYAFQDFSSVPDFYQIPPERTKPFGTVHALLCAADVVHEPFCVINADDYYGVDAYRTIYQELTRLPAEGKATMVGYQLKNTASLHGTVSRGICQVQDGKLRSIREALKVQLYPDGTLRDLAEGVDLAPETVVSCLRECGAPLVGLSALMTTTAQNIAVTIRAIRSAGIPCKVMVGGAVVTQSFAEQVGADFYAKDAAESARYAAEVFRSR